MVLTRVGRIVVSAGVVLLAGGARLCASDLRLRAVEGQGMVVAPGASSPRRIVVAVENAQGRAISGATVRFRLPAEGPTGRFASGLTTESVLSGPDGRASVMGIAWNGEAGRVAVAVTCTLGEQTAELEVPVEIGERKPKGSSVTNPGHFPSAGSNRKWLILVAVIGGGAAVGAASMMGHSSTPTPPYTPPPINIAAVPPTVGTPSISITAPGH